MHSLKLINYLEQVVKQHIYPVTLSCIYLYICISIFELNFMKTDAALVQ